MNILLAEIADMPDAALRFAWGVSEVWTPEHLVPFRDTVRNEHHADLVLLFGALKERFPDAGSHFGVFQAAAEMALMEYIAAEQLAPDDRDRLRQLWEALRHAR